MAIISLSLPCVVEAMPFTTVPRLCQLVPLFDERATTMAAPLAEALCDISM